MGRTTDKGLNFPQLFVFSAATSGTVPTLPQGLSILIVEDSEDTREATEAMLKTLGADLTSASDGRDALNAIATGQPDLALCDLAMPRMDGFEFIQELAPAPGPPAIAFVAFNTVVERCCPLARSGGQVCPSRSSLLTAVT